MRLTLYSDYALRLLMRLAASPRRLVTIEEVARGFGISRNHLMKVAHQLGTAGFIETVRGRGGGLRLNRSASDITVGEVVRTTEEDFRLVECFDPERNRCVIAPVCRLRHALTEALDAYLAVLDRYSVADIAEPSGVLLALLGSPRDGGSCELEVIEQAGQSHSEAPFERAP